MKHPQTKFHAHTMRESQVITSKKVKIFLQQFFFLHQYFIETTATDSDMLLQVWLQFCSNGGFVATSGIIMLFAHYWTIE